MQVTTLLSLLPFLALTAGFPLTTTQSDAVIGRVARRYEVSDREH